MNVIHCYPPTNNSNEAPESNTIDSGAIQIHCSIIINSDDEIKDQFYSIPQSILGKCRENNMTTIMGDFNAKIGMANGYEEVTGTHGVEEMIENEERFADTCALINIVIGGSILTHTERYARSHYCHLIMRQTAR